MLGAICRSGNVTDKEIGTVLSSMVYIVDTREKSNSHILEFFKENGIPYKVEKLDSGDYSVEVTANGFESLSKSVIVERKNSLTEISGNFTKNRERFEREFNRATENKQSMHLLVETATWKSVFNGNYRSQMSPKSMVSSLLTFSIRYNVPVWFVGKAESGRLIHELLYYGVREKLKNL